MKTFKHFPKNLSNCPVCNRDDDLECTLVMIDGTDAGNICQAQPVHTDCLELRISQETGIIYQICEKNNEKSDNSRPENISSTSL